jgi:hypothetical protein
MIGRKTLARAPEGVVAVLALTQPAFAQSSGDGAGLEGLVGLAVLVIVLLAAYFIPTIVAFRRGHPSRWPIFLLNLVFGGTVLGWVGALIWATHSVHKPAVGTQGGESGLNIFANDTKTVRMHSDTNGDDLAEQLLRLKRLVDAGAISATEYEALRRPIVAQL